MVELMVSYFYDLTYSCGDTTDNANNPNDSTAVASDKHIITHAKMFALAVKYQANDLRHFAMCSFRHAAQKAWDSDAFLEAIDIVFTSTPEDVSDLRDVVLDTIYDHFQGIMDKPEIEEVVCNHPKLTYGLMKRKTNYSQYQPLTTKSACTVCHESKLDSDFASGLPKICMRCNIGPHGWYESSWE